MNHSKDIPNTSNRVNETASIRTSRLKSLLLGASLCAGAGGLLLTSGCAVNPATGTPDLVFMSESKELELGKELHEQLMASTPVYADETLVAYVEKVGQKMAKASHRTDIDYTFTIIDSPDINAFALPGGFIYVNRGLLSYLQSEAQLAAVLGHEIGHVTARHAVRQDTARKGSGAATVLSVLATGSTVVGDVADLYGTAAVRGYGRDMELEADSLGAEYLHNAGYNPNAMLDVIGILKDQERFSRRQALDTGKEPVSYHGVFSTHPRNDKRLQEVVGKASELSDKQQGVDNFDEYRQHIEGMVYGVNFQAQTAAQAAKNTYSHSKLGFSIDFPNEWETENLKEMILAKAPDDHAQMTIKVDLLKKQMSPADYIESVLGIEKLDQSQAFNSNGLPGHTGLLPPLTTANSEPRRLAVIFQGRLVYIIEGETTETITAQEEKENSKEKDQTTHPDDKLFVASIRSFRPTAASRQRSGKNKEIHFVKANRQTTFAALADFLKLGEYGEEQLRLLNGYYPRGEPEAGDWVKIVM